MSARLTTAIRIGESANALLQRIKSFDRKYLSHPEDWNERAHIGIEPMLLALSMELALKAWFVFDHDTPDVKRTHNLIKLFEVLKKESQEKLDTEFKKSVAPSYPSGLFINYGIRHLLLQHANAFVDWRYLHEPKNTSFQEGAFIATLEMVLREFRKRYRIVDVPSIWPSG